MVGAMMVAKVAGAAVQSYMQQEINEKNREAYKKIKAIKTETAEMQNEYNKEQIENAYAANYADTMNKFVDSRREITDNLLKEIDAKTTALGQTGAVELSGSSFNYDNVKATADQNFMENLNNLATTQEYTMKGMSSQKQAQLFGVQSQTQGTLNAIANMQPDQVSGAGAAMASALGGAVTTYDKGGFDDMFNTGGDLPAGMGEEVIDIGGTA